MHCIFCSGTSIVKTEYPAIFFNGRHFQYVRCRNCRLVFLDNLPVQEDYVAMYPPAYQQNRVETDIQKDVYLKLPGLRFSYGYQFDLIKKSNGPQAHILDYGCGTGHFIANAIHAGFTCDGAEFNPEYLKLLSGKLNKSNFYPIADIISGNFDKRYDVIRMSNVLEHLTAPSEIIARLMALLKPDGLLLVEGPIEENFCLATSFRKLYFRLQKWISPARVVTAPPYHIFFSNAKNQKKFFEDCGLSEIHFKTQEEPWPFPPSWKAAKGMQQKLMAMVAGFSIFFTRLFPFQWGNVFIYTGKQK